MSHLALRYDLHSHSHHSDGTLTPGQLVAYALEQGVDVLALTDHDTTDGVAPAKLAAASTSLALVPGVEISATWAQRTIHVVGLNIDITNPVLQTGLHSLREIRDVRAQKMVERLEQRGIEGVDQGVRDLVAGPILSRTHFARYLVQAGHAGSLSQAFKKFLSKGKPGYVSGHWTGLAEVVQWIKTAGGQAVIAHPGRYKLGRGKLRQLVTDFRECGGDAIEVLSGTQQPKDSEYLARLSQELGLLASVGSDYHGPEQHWLNMGQMPQLPSQCVPVWHDWPH